MPPVPNVKDLYEKLNNKPPSGMAWEAFRTLSAGKGFDKALFLPPGTPPEIARVYWAASDRMMKDAAFRKIVDPMVGAEAKWMWGEAVEKAFKLTFAFDPKVIEWVKETMGKYGTVVE